MTRAAPLWPRVVLGTIIVLLIAGLGELFRARFASGDVYPRYSSLRGDPLGTRVYCEALQDAGIEVGRNFRDLRRASLGRATIYLAGMAWADLASGDVEDFKSLLDSVRAGSRLVVAFAPDGGELSATVPARAKPKPEEKPKAGKPEKDAPTPLLRELGVDARWLPAGRQDLEAVREGGAEMPEHLAWHSALALEPDKDAPWRRLYSVGRYAAILEREYGAGSIVLVGDVFPLSNEAMARARQTALLSWIQGAQAAAIFDETHLGVVENAGIAALARRYGLTHAAFALLAVAVLYAWRNASPLVPPRRESGTEPEAMEGRDASSGLVNLLRRTLPAGSLFATCVSEYRRSLAWRRTAPGARQSLEALSATDRGDGRRILEAMRSAHELLRRRI